MEQPQLPPAVSALIVQLVASFPFPTKSNFHLGALKDGEFMWRFEHDETGKLVNFAVRDEETGQVYVLDWKPVDAKISQKSPGLN